MLDKNDLAEFFPFIFCFLGAGFLIVFTHPQDIATNSETQSMSSWTFPMGIVKN
jgi:hypothetical protein